MSPKTKPTKPIGIYVRVSQRRGREGDSFRSPAQQEQRCRAQLQADGLEAYPEVFIDLDQSGAKPSRPAFDRAMTLVEEGVLGGIIVHDLSRFGRSTKNVLNGVDWLESHGAVFISCAEKFDTSTPSGRFVLRMFASLRELELDTITERFQLSRQDYVAAGGWAAVAPFGFDLVEVEGDGRRVKALARNADTDKIEAAFRLKAQGARWRQIAECLGVPYPTARYILSNAVYREQGVVSAALFQQAQNGNGRRGGVGAGPGNGRGLLSGLVKCAGCGGTLVYNSTKSRSGKPYRFMRCQNKACPEGAAISADKLEEFLKIQVVLLGAQVTEPSIDLTPFEEKLAAAQAQWDALAQSMGVDPPEDSKQTRALRAAEAALEKARFEADGIPLIAEAVERYLNASDEDGIRRARRVIKVLLGEVVVHKGKMSLEQKVVIERADQPRGPIFFYGRRRAG
jgi:site-specific DNA recombinase